MDAFPALSCLQPCFGQNDEFADDEEVSEASASLQESEYVPREAECRESAQELEPVPRRTLDLLESDKENQPHGSPGPLGSDDD